MEVQVRNAHGQLPAAAKEYGVKRIEKLTRYFDKITSAEIVYEEVRGQHTIELQLNADGYFIRGTGANGNPRTALDNAIDHVEARLRRFRKKLNDRNVGRGFAGGGGLELLDEVEVDDTENAEPIITKFKKFSMRPLSVEDAALQMELSSRDHFIFKNHETGEVNLLYRLPDGNYALVEPE